MLFTTIVSRISAPRPAGNWMFPGTCSLVRHALPRYAAHTVCHVRRPSPLSLLLAYRPPIVSSDFSQLNVLRTRVRCPSSRVSPSVFLFPLSVSFSLPLPPSRRES